VTVLAQSVNGKADMLEAVRLLAVICVVSQEGHAKVLDGLTVSSEMAMLGTYCNSWVGIIWAPAS
jgi:hypothetical protein